MCINKNILRQMVLFVTVIALAIPMVGCGVQQTENMLAAAGFEMKLADTPEKLEHLKTLSQHNIVAHQRDGEVYYVYADASQCKCLYIGDAQAYQQFQKLALQQRLADERLATAQAAESSAMRWDMWGGPRMRLRR